MRTVVLGAPGQLGRDLVPRLVGKVIGLSRKDADLADASSLRAVLSANRPDVVINCAAYNLVDQAETDIGAAFSANAFAVRDLAIVCQELRCLLVQISTDYVFGLETDRLEPLSENDSPGPVGVYGASKLCGEYFIRNICERHLIIRTCGLYGVWGSGGKGKNFVETMLRLADQGKPISVVNDQRCTPSYTVDVAAAINDLVSRNVATGVYHVTNSGDCSWFELAREIFRIAKKQVDLRPISTAEFGAKARRPAYSVLSNQKLGSVGVPELPHWTDAVARYLQERDQKSAETPSA